MSAPVDSIQPDTGELVGTFLENIVFGLAILMGGRTIKFVLKARRDPMHQINIIFVIAPIILLLIATVHLVVDWYRMFGAFLNSEDRTTRTLYLSDPSQRHYFAKDFVYIWSTLIGDAVLVYRSYMVWSKNIWVAILPTMMILTSVGLGMTTMHQFLTNQLGDIFQVKAIVYAYFSLTIASTVWATAFILLRLYLSDRSTRGVRTRLSFLPIMLVILESGAIYCAICITMFVLYAVGSYSHLMILNPMPSIIVVLFSFVLLRIVDRDGGNDVYSRSYNSRAETGFTGSAYNRSRMATTGSDREHHLSGVKVTQFIQMTPPSAPSSYDGVKNTSLIRTTEDGLRNPSDTELKSGSAY